MEVFSIFSSDKFLIDGVIDFLLENQSIKFAGRDEDTIYLESIDSSSIAFYIHFKTDFDEEMELNFDKDDKEYIKQSLGDKTIYMVDISYKDSYFMYKFLSDFIKDWKIDSRSKVIPILFHDPFKGFINVSAILNYR